MQNYHYLAINFKGSMVTVWPSILTIRMPKYDQKRAGETTSLDTWVTPGNGPRARGTGGNQPGIIRME